MVFGEIVEPSTRALIDEDEYPAYAPPTYEWIGDVQSISNAASLIFVETKRMHNIFQKFILQDMKPICSLNNNVKVYKLPNHFIISYSESFNDKNELTTGEIVKALETYIEGAKKIYTITSSSLYSYQGELDRDRVECIFKYLSTEGCENFGCDKLLSPNFITGLGADIFTYCIYKGLKCISFILYYKNTDIDSMSSRPVLEVAEKLGLSPKEQCKRVAVPTHNLYM